MKSTFIGIIFTLFASILCSTAKAEVFYLKKHGLMYYCELVSNNVGGSFQCVRNCVGGYRDAAGTQCISFGPDFCGVNVQCVRNCVGGYYDAAGTQCRSFGPDICTKDN